MRRGYTIEACSRFSIASISAGSTYTPQPSVEALPSVNRAPPAAQPPVKVRPANPGVALVRDGGTFKVPVIINGALTLNFTVDSGASDVLIPADVVFTLIRTGTLKNTDFLGEQTYMLADGSMVPSKIFRIRTLRVGDRTIENVLGSMASVSSSLLLGQSFLSRFSKVSFDYNRQILLLE